jgi:hypothetical protein
MPICPFAHVQTHRRGQQTFSFYSLVTQAGQIEDVFKAPANRTQLGIAPCQPPLTN